MSKLNEDYFIRKCCLENNEVPSQSIMRNKMGSALAEVYFKSMSPNLKVIAGLEPPLKGGGANWYMPPEDSLKGRAVLKPVQKRFLKKFSSDGIMSFGKKFVHDHRRILEIQKKQMLLNSDENWKKTIVERGLQEWDAVSARETNKNTLKIKQAVHEFSVVYRTSLTNIESLLKDTSKIELEQIKQYTYDELQIKFETSLEEQRQQLFEDYEEMLEKEQNKCKEKFLHDNENLRVDFEQNISVMNTEKYKALEKLRTILGYQNLACQVYVALEERTECEKDIEVSKQEHENSIKLLSEQIKKKDARISSTVEEIMKQKEINRMWQNKICHVVRRFQEFVKYCLHEMPDQAEFFINMEKLMLLQLSEVLDNPRAVNIFEIEEEQLQTDAPKPHPFILVCDEETSRQLEPDVCLQPSTSRMSVIVVNKRCIYAACDNLELLGDKLEEYLAGNDLNDGAIDEHDYDLDVPIHCTSSEQLLELKLESSLMQILRDEFLNIRQVKTQCAVCGSHYCFCSPTRKESKVVVQAATSPEPSKKLNKTNILKFVREPKIRNNFGYLDYIRPDECNCAIKTKKHLEEHLPAYMKNVSAFEKVDIPQYEPCGVYEFKKLVKAASNVQETRTETKAKDVASQYSHQEFDDLCESFSDREIQRFLKELCILSKEKDPPDAFQNGLPASHEKEAPTFVFEAERTLQQMISESPKLEEIFKSKCGT